MKKILPILIILAMVASTIPMAMAENGPEYPEGNPEEPCAWVDNDTQCNINTQVQLTGGSSGSTVGNNAPYIKCKWEWDDEFVMPVEDCPDDCIDCPDGCPDFNVVPAANGDGLMRHDACPCADGLQVAVDLESKVKVGVAAVVADYQGYEDIKHVYADIWHPDGQFKFQIELYAIPYIDKEQSLEMFNHFYNCHNDLITFNGYTYDDIIDELNEPLALLYVGSFELDYCQPGGHYTVAVRAHDTMNAWSDYLYNYFWYIPTTAVRLDFSSIDYGDVSVCVNKWVGGNEIMSNGDLKPTAKNIGNTPVDLYVWQDDMDFGQTDSAWNVEFDARLTADGNIVTYDPYQSAANHKGVRIPGFIPLCTQDKLDFSIHVIKGEAGYQYAGKMCISAYRHGNPVWKTPSQFVGNAPGSIEQDIYPAIDPTE